MIRKKQRLNQVSCNARIGVKGEDIYPLSDESIAQFELDDVSVDDTLQLVVDARGNPLAAEGSVGLIEEEEEQAEAAAAAAAKHHLMSESAFKKKFGFGFEGFSMNPFDKPHFSMGVDALFIHRLDETKFNSWLSSSPYVVWVTKVKDKSPYATCKFDKCEHRFTLHGNPTSSNIVRHLKRKHSIDYERFQAGLANANKEKSPGKSNAQDGRDISESMFLGRLTTKFQEFLTINADALRELNELIAGLIPFSSNKACSKVNPRNNGGLNFLDATANSESERRHVEFSLSPRESRTQLLRQYEKHFNEQLKDDMQKSSNISIFIENWISSSTGRSHFIVLACFCPCFNKEEKLKNHDLSSRTKARIHVLDLIELGEQKNLTAENLRSSLLKCITNYSIQSKINAITLGYDSRNTISEVLHRGVNLMISKDIQKEVIIFKSMRHILGEAFLVLFQSFRNLHSDLLLRVDKLIEVTTNNPYIRKRLRQYISKNIERCDASNALSHYSQLKMFLKASKGIERFFNDNRPELELQLEKNSRSVFCYSHDELKLIGIFVRLTRVFHEVTLLLQDDTTNSLCNGIEYYAIINQYYKSCKLIKDGSSDCHHLQNIGLKEQDLSVTKQVRDRVLSAVLSSWPIFEKCLKTAFNEPAYWVAHILQPNCKTSMLDRSFDQAFRDGILHTAELFFDDYCKQFINSSHKTLPKKALATLNVNRKSDKTFKVAKQLHTYVNRNKNEWQAYLEEPIEEEEKDYVDYWIKNRKRFPTLYSLALSLHHTKLAATDSEEWFSVSMKAMTNNFTTASSNLKSTMIIRNRIKCFGPKSKNFAVAQDIPSGTFLQEEEEEELSEFLQNRGSEESNIMEMPSNISSDDEF